MITFKAKREKETKRTVRYAETEDTDFCGIIYLRKSALLSEFSGYPDKIVVTVVGSDDSGK